MCVQALEYERDSALSPATHVKHGNLAGGTTPELRQESAQVEQLARRTQSNGLRRGTSIPFSRRKHSRPRGRQASGSSTSSSEASRSGSSGSASRSRPRPRSHSRGRRRAHSNGSASQSRHGGRIAMVIGGIPSVDLSLFYRSARPKLSLQPCKDMYDELLRRRESCTDIRA